MPSRRVVNDTIKAGNRAQIPTAEEVIAARAQRREQARARRRRLALSLRAVLLAALGVLPALALRLILSTTFQLLSLVAFFVMRGQPIAAGLCALAVVIADSGATIGRLLSAQVVLAKRRDMERKEDNRALVRAIEAVVRKQGGRP